MQLGVSVATPTPVVLAEMGERPLWMRWLQRGVHFLNRCLQAGDGSLVRRALVASCNLAADGDKQCWAAHLHQALDAVGLQLDLQQLIPVGKASIKAACWERQAHMLNLAASRPGASRLQHYVVGVNGGAVTAASISVQQPYLRAVRERQRRQALAQLRVGSHWGAEEKGRCQRQRVPREQRTCPHCTSGAIEDVAHMVLHCPLYDEVRASFADLFSNLPDEPTLAHFFNSPQGGAIRTARFAAALSRVSQATRPT